MTTKVVKKRSQYLLRFPPDARPEDIELVRELYEAAPRGERIAQLYRATLLGTQILLNKRSQAVFDRKT